MCRVINMQLKICRIEEKCLTNVVFDIVQILYRSSLFDVKSDSGNHTYVMAIIKKKINELDFHINYVGHFFFLFASLKCSHFLCVHFNLRWPRVFSRSACLLGHPVVLSVFLTQNCHSCLHCNHIVIIVFFDTAWYFMSSLTPHTVVNHAFFDTA